MPFQSHIGEVASLLTAVCWTLSAIFFEKAGRRTGSLSVNIIRIFLGILFLGITTLFTRGMFFPMDATPYNWFWLGLSGIVGFFLGDLFLFKSYILIGSRTSQLVMSLAPMITAVIGWFFLQEILSLKNIGGILVSVAGIMIASSRVIKQAATTRNLFNTKPPSKFNLLIFLLRLMRKFAKF